VQQVIEGEAFTVVFLRGGGGVLLTKVQKARQTCKRTFQFLAKKKKKKKRVSVSHAGAPRKPVFTFRLASQFIGLKAGRDFPFW
jgi:hypothetical protein